MLNNLRFLLAIWCGELLNAADQSWVSIPECKSVVWKVVMGWQNLPCTCHTLLPCTVRGVDCFQCLERYSVCIYSVSTPSLANAVLSCALRAALSAAEPSDCLQLTYGVYTRVGKMVLSTACVFQMWWKRKLAYSLGLYLSYVYMPSCRLM